MTTDSMVEPTPQRGMSDAEQALSQTFYEAVQSWTTESERSRQARALEIGVSDLGWCSEFMRRTLDGQVPEEVDMLPAFLGTAIGDHFEQAVVAKYPNVLRQQEVTVTLKGESGQVYDISGHPDLILPEEGIVVDEKAPHGLQLARRMGADQQKSFQKHLYALGSWEKGYFGDRPLEEVQVANLWIDRSGVEREFHVQLEPFDPGVVDLAAQWVDEVVYAYVNGQEARKEPAREVCAKTCGFFRVCRAYDTDVSGRLTDPEVLEALHMYVEGKEMASAGEKMKKQAKAALKGFEGSDGQYALRWTWVNETVVSGFTRRGYHKIDIQDLKA